MMSSHVYLGLPLGLVVKGFRLNFFLAALVSGILCILPNQLSLWTLMWLTIFHGLSVCPILHCFLSSMFNSVPVSLNFMEHFL